MICPICGHAAHPKACRWLMNEGNIHQGPCDCQYRMASTFNGAPALRPTIVRCTWCGREVREDWTPDVSPDEQLCARCREMVIDPFRGVE